MMQMSTHNSKVVLPKFSKKSLYVTDQLIFSNFKSTFSMSQWTRVHCSEVHRITEPLRLISGDHLSNHTARSRVSLSWLPRILNTSTGRDITTSGQPVPGLDHTQSENVFCLIGISSIFICAHCLLHIHWAPLRRVRCPVNVQVFHTLPIAEGTFRNLSCCPFFPSSDVTSNRLWHS